MGESPQAGSDPADAGSDRGRAREQVANLEDLGALLIAAEHTVARSPAPDEPPAADRGDDAAEVDEPAALVVGIARQVAEAQPEGCRTWDAVFALTVSDAATRVAYSDGERVISTVPSDAALGLVRRHRELSAASEDGPWWRMTLRANENGEVEAVYDYGREPFPEGQLFAPESYREDLRAYPRARLPVWLAAYIGHGGKQSRTPQEAAREARADRAGEVWSLPAGDELPDYRVMWARWAVIAAAFVAVGSEWGPRMLPALGWFESSQRSGSTLYVLPGGRAVLSGGVWDAPELDDAYNEDYGMPEFYAGAPHWVADPVLNPRAATGLLSFCYWWEEGRWYRGESPSAEECAGAVPGMWTTLAVVEMIAGLVADQLGPRPPNDRLRMAAAALVSAAELGVVTRAVLAAAFPADDCDVDGALYQLSLAGLVAAGSEPMLRAQAIMRVRQYLEWHGPGSADGQPSELGSAREALSELGSAREALSELGSAREALSELVAERFEVGWMVYVPVGGQPAGDWPVCYIGDDGVVEQSPLVEPSVFMADFEQRFRRRWGPEAQ